MVADRHVLQRLSAVEFPPGEGTGGQWGPGGRGVDVGSRGSEALDGQVNNAGPTKIKTDAEKKMGGGTAGVVPEKAASSGTAQQRFGRGRCGQSGSWRLGMVSRECCVGKTGLEAVGLRERSCCGTRTHAPEHRHMGWDEQLPRLQHLFGDGAFTTATGSGRTLWQRRGQ